MWTEIKILILSYGPYVQFVLASVLTLLYTLISLYMSDIERRQLKPFIGKAVISIGVVDLLLSLASTRPIIERLVKNLPASSPILSLEETRIAVTVGMDDGRAEAEKQLRKAVRESVIDEFQSELWQDTQEIEEEARDENDRGLVKRRLIGAWVADRDTQQQETLRFRENEICDDYFWNGSSARSGVYKILSPQLVEVKWNGGATVDYPLHLDEARRSIEMPNHGGTRGFIDPF